jgi:hypothetical protein
MTNVVKSLIVIASVFLVTTVFADKFLTSNEFINGVEYTRKPQGEVFILSIPLTIIILFIYQKLAEKFDL